MVASKRTYGAMKDFPGDLPLLYDLLHDALPFLERDVVTIRRGCGWSFSRCLLLDDEVPIAVRDDGHEILATRGRTGKALRGLSPGRASPTLSGGRPIGGADGL